MLIGERRLIFYTRIFLLAAALSISALIAFHRQSFELTTLSGLVSAFSLLFALSLYPVTRYIRMMRTWDRRLRKAQEEVVFWEEMLYIYFSRGRETLIASLNEKAPMITDNNQPTTPLEERSGKELSHILASGKVGAYLLLSRVESEPGRYPRYVRWLHEHRWLTFR